MKLLSQPQPTRRRPEQAFTLVEIVLSLAIIAIAMVAIIGVIPIGLNVQADNQEESIVSADAAIWMEALRSGAQGIAYLAQTNGNAAGDNFYISEVMVQEVERRRSPVSPLLTDDAVIRSNITYLNRFTSGSNLLGVLSRPKYPLGTLLPGQVYTNWNVYADVRALNGNLADLSGDLDFAFKYRLIPELVPIQGVDPRHLIDPMDTNAFPRSLPVMSTNLFELRLTCKWPLIVGAGGNYRSQSGFQKSLTFRTLVSGQQMLQTNLANGSRLDFMAPRQYSFDRPIN